MASVRSKDGTKIGFDKQGSGSSADPRRRGNGKPGDGLRLGAALLLGKDFTVYVYDWRGRNESGDTQPYAVEREIRGHRRALIDDAGGSAFVYGISSGAALALEAASRLGGKVLGLALYEAPYGSPAQGDGPDPFRGADVPDALEQLVEIIVLPVAGRIFQPLVVQRESLDDVFPQPLRGPLAELRAPVRFHPVTDGNDDIQVVDAQFRSVFPSAAVELSGISR